MTYRSTRRIRPLVALMNTAIVCGAVACTTEETAPTEWTDPAGVPVTWKAAEADKADWTFTANTTYIKAPRSDDVQVLDGSLVTPLAGFEDLLTLAPGAILIGGPNKDLAPTNPDGFLRKVKSVAQQGQTIVIQTDIAELSDAFETCAMVGTFQLPDFGDLVFTAADGSQMSPQSFEVPDGLHPEVAFNVGGTVLLDEPALKATLTKGTFSFVPEFHFTLEGSLLHGLEKFETVAIGNASSEIEVQLVAPQGLSKDFKKTFTAGDLSFGIGPLNVKVTPTLDVGCSVDIPSGISVTAGAKATSQVALGVSFVKDQGLSPIAQSNFTLTRTGPSFAQSKPATARCFIHPSLAARLSVVVASAGSTLALEASSTLSAQANKGFCSFDYDVGAKGTADVDVKLFGAQVLNHDFTLFNVNKKLADNITCGN